MFAVDLSASMLHDAQGRKRETVAEICSMLSMAAIKNQDRVGLILFTDKVEQVIPPGKGRTQALRIMDALSNYQPEGTQTNIVEMLNRFGHITKKRSIVFVVSDFLSEDYSRELQSLAYKHDINAIHIADNSLSEANKLSGLVRIEDAETGQQRVIDSQDQASSRQHQSSIQQQMLESGVDLLSVPVGADCADALAGFFHSRHRKEADETGG